MKIVCPQIFTYASLISITLLLVYATPIPPPDATSTLDTLPTRIFPGMDKSAASQLLDQWNKIDLIQKEKDQDISNAINKVAEFFPQIASANDLRTIMKVVSKISDAKFYVSTCASKQKQIGVKAIEDFEAAAVSKLPRGQELYKTPEIIRQSIEEFKANPLATDEKLRHHQQDKLNLLVKVLSHLRITEQRKMRQELQDACEAVHAMINGWQEDYWKTMAMKAVDRWNAFNSLVVDASPV
ncbi:hypothetical protein H0H93_007823 [Arthromyces matolae]|nr:hypothetical protein H0H93_007820 [Arthromyces matolae]KAG6849520.1 hypothetical protein H0H93_007823 [Arthromyces matolae]